ncbi:MAG TPA: SDR family oxidoreductase [Pseudohongiella sp.]|nr:SDR family oxidoreductase [Pseudohongiella sp.]
MSNYIVTGTNRGIGLEFVSRLLSQGHQVIATARNPEAVPALQDLLSRYGSQLSLLPLDLADENSLNSFASRIGDQPVDVLINNAGVYGPRDAVLGNLRGKDWAETLWIDIIAPMLLTQSLLPALRRGTDKRIAFLSSKMGSIDDNTSGGSYVYRSAKTGLNQAVKSLSIDLRDEGFVVLPLHPGWVKTDMGGPGALIDTNTSVSGLLNLIQYCGIADSGKFFAYDGKQIAW